MNVSNESMLLLLRHVRKHWDPVEGVLLDDTFLVCALFLVDFHVIDLQIGYDLSLALNRLMLVALKLLHLIIFTLVAKCDHRAEENIYGLFRYIILLQPFPVNRSFALPSLV